MSADAPHAIVPLSQRPSSCALLLHFIEYDLSHDIYLFKNKMICYLLYGVKQLNRVCTKLWAVTPV